MRPGSFPGQILDLLRLRAGPQALPYSPALLLRLAVLAFALDLFASMQLDPENVAPLRFVVSFGLGFLLTWVLLSAFGRRARFVQTMLALLGTGIVLSLLFLPLALLALANGMADPETTPGPRQALLAWLMLVTVVWKIAVTANIWRHALEWPLPAGVGVALVLFALEFGIDRWLFAGAAA